MIDLQHEIDRIMGELHAARVQRAPSDDAIIAEHIDAAYDSAQAVRRSLRKDSPVSPLERAQQAAAARLLTLKPPRIVGQGDAADAQNIADYLREIIAAVDPLIAAVGAYVADNFSQEVDLSLFENQLLGALDGEALHELSALADRAAEDAAEMRADRRGWDAAVRAGVD